MTYWAAIADGGGLQARLQATCLRGAKREASLLFSEGYPNRTVNILEGGRVVASRVLKPKSPWVNAAGGQ